jgi:hypothetical protein
MNIDENLNTCISIDWLQLNCSRSGGKLADMAGKYKIVKLDHQTRHFKSVYEVYLFKNCVASIAMEPHSSVLAPDMALLKIENKYLYNSELSEFVEDLLKSLSLQLNNITRLDLALDFNYFCDGTHPAKFIKEFLYSNIIKHGKSKYKVMGAQDANLTFEYLKFGSETSIISYYLYNKSKELAEKKNKPWITDTWKANAINTDIDVWRLEFSIKSNLNELMNLETSEAWSMNKLIVLTENLKLSLMNCLLQKYWLFSFPHDDKNRSRWPKIKLFDLDTAKCILIRLSEKKESNRSDKIFLKKLVEYSDEMRGQDFNNSIFADQLIKHAITSRGLVKWAKEKQLI